MRRGAVIFGLLCLFAASARAADRAAEFNKLVDEYNAAEKTYRSEPIPHGKRTAENLLADSERWPGWKFVPRISAIAEALPSDEVAFRACQWIVERAYDHGNDDPRIYYAVEKAWRILGEQHAARTEISDLCLYATGADAIKFQGPAREQFLRSLSRHQELPFETRANATMGLADIGK